MPLVVADPGLKKVFEVPEVECGVGVMPVKIVCVAGMSRGAGAGLAATGGLEDCATEDEGGAELECAIGEGLGEGEMGGGGAGEPSCLDLLPVGDVVAPSAFDTFIDGFPLPTTFDVMESDVMSDCVPLPALPREVLAGGIVSLVSSPVASG